MSLAIIGCAGQISMGGGKKILINAPLAAPMRERRTIADTLRWLNIAQRMETPSRQ
jgi:hypothetical protein